MATDKKIFVPSEVFLYDANGDLSKRWFVWFYDHDLRRKKLYKGINVHETLSQRYEAADALIASIRKVSEPTLVRHIKKFLEYRSRNVRQSSFLVYRGQINRFLAFNQGEAVTQEKCHRFVEHLRHEGLTGNTIYQYISLLEGCWAWLMKDKLVHFNPWSEIEIKRTEQKSAVPYQKSHIEHLKTHMIAHHPQLWLVVQFLFYCFIRPGELSKMKVGDLILENKQIRVQSAYSKNNKTQSVTIPEAFWPVVEKLYKGVNPNHYVIGKRVYGPG
ncbi:MAG: phage integrase SAM-like domain-containing protein, partial [Bacteroidota bacterium]